MECCTSQPYYEHYSPRECFLMDAVDNDRCANCGKLRTEHDKQDLDSWTTSAALLFSSVVKLKAASKPGKVYRGVREDDVQLPEGFVTSKDGGFAKGVELGAMSTTFDEKVALSYADSAKRFSLFEIEFNAAVTLKQHKPPSEPLSSPSPFAPPCRL